MLDRGELVVVEKDHSTRLDQAAEEEQIDKQPVEAVVAVDEGEIELFARTDEPGKHDLGLLGVVLDERGDPCLFKKLESQSGEPRVLVRVDGDVAGSHVSDGKQPVTDIDSRDPVSEADLDRASGAFSYDPVPKLLSLGRSGRYGKELMYRAVGVGRRCTGAENLLDQPTNTASIHGGRLGP